MSSRTVRSWSAQAAAARIVVQVVVREVIQGGGRGVERGVGVAPHACGLPAMPAGASTDGFLGAPPTTTATSTPFACLGGSRPRSAPSAGKVALPRPTRVGRQVTAAATTAPTEPPAKPHGMGRAAPPSGPGTDSARAPAATTAAAERRDGTARGRAKRAWMGSHGGEG